MGKVSPPPHFIPLMKLIFVCFIECYFAVISTNGVYLGKVSPPFPTWGSRPVRAEMRATMSIELQAAIRAFLGASCLGLPTREKYLERAYRLAVTERGAA